LKEPPPGTGVDEPRGVAEVDKEALDVIELDRERVMRVSSRTVLMRRTCAVEERQRQRNEKGKKED